MFGKTDKEFIQYLYISLGSLSELETLFIISTELNYLNNKNFTEINQKIEKVRPMLLGLIKYLKRKPK